MITDGLVTIGIPSSFIQTVFFIIDDGLWYNFTNDNPYRNRNLNLQQSLRLAILLDPPQCYYIHLQRLFHGRNWVQNGRRFRDPRDGPVVVAARCRCCFWHCRS